MRHSNKLFRGSRVQRCVSGLVNDGAGGRRRGSGEAKVCPAGGGGWYG